MQVTATQAKNRFGAMCAHAKTEPVFVEKDGRIDSVIVSAKQFAEHDNQKNRHQTVEHIHGRKSKGALGVKQVERRRTVSFDIISLFRTMRASFSQRRDSSVGRASD